MLEVFWQFFKPILVVVHDFILRRKFSTVALYSFILPREDKMFVAINGI